MPSSISLFYPFSLHGQTIAVFSLNVLLIKFGFHLFQHRNSICQQT
jgi:hypothetical protein